MSEDTNKDENEKTDEHKDMGFFDHLEELRKRIIFSLIALILTCILSAVFVDKIMEYVLLKPAIAAHLDLQNLRPFGQPFLYFKVIFVVGIIAAFPFLLFQLWRFVAPGLYVNERKWVRQITFFTSVCFLIGVMFAYFLMIPSMLSFAASFGTSKIKNIIDVNEYFSFITIMLLASGLLFEMPMVSFVLSRFGIVSAGFLRKYRRHGIIINLVLAAAITPTTDPISMMIFAVPLLMLYEISVFVAAFGEKSKKKKEAAKND